MPGGEPLSVIALSAAGTVLAGLTSLVLCSGRADRTLVVLASLVTLAAAGALPFVWSVTFGRP